MFALICNGVVHDLLAVDPALELDPERAGDLKVVDVSNVPGIAVGWFANADGTFRAPALPTVDLAALKASLKAQVDAAAEALRLTLITPGSGQAMEYQEAYAEAVQVDAAAKAGQAVDGAGFPMLTASIGYDVDPQTKLPSVDVVGEARAVLAAYDAYQRAGAAIRAARLKAKAAIDAAASVDAARAAFAAIAWPTFA